ncbi:hypothetical protein ACFY8X_38695 [Streptomyces tanashiensis]|jgi:hypothetical protein|uniref:hypothetical protein n=1 Tax=Streptomyces tanashiensis TaxID=67367 RepID=UPI0036EA26EA
MTTPEPASLADETRPVRIVTDGSSAQVIVDGVDLSRRLRGYTLEHRVTQPPMLVLYAGAALDAAFEGLAHVVVGDEPDPGPAVADFLRAIDPAALERAALDRDDLDGSRHELTRAMLAQLTDWALGKATG